MATERQRNANRKNAQLSTGPKTAVGKSRSSVNAVKTGFFSKAMHLTPQEEAEFTALQVQLEKDYLPATATEAFLVQKIARCIWRQRLLAAAETARQELAARHQLQQALRAALPPRQTLEEKTRAYYKNLSCEELALMANHPTPLADMDISLTEVARIAPGLLERIEGAAAANGMTLAFFLGEVGGVVGFLESERNRETAITEEESNLRIARLLIEEVQRAPLSDESLIRAQAALDNELYKALKKLEELQDRRKGAERHIVQSD